MEDLKQATSSLFLFPWRGLALLCAALLTFTVPLSANGQKETTYKQAQGSQTFTGTIDLTDQKPGTYNVVIKTTDEAGNVSYSGPFNIINDPDSAKPVVTVASPDSGTRVNANVNIVGAAIATEGVGRVEVRVDGAEWKSASGTSFWSYSLDISPYPDGPHLVEVRGVDVHGLEGKIVSVPVTIDQFKPLITIANHVSGDRITGDIELQGVLADGNGLGGMSLSTDDAKTWKNLVLSGDEKATSRPWTARLASRNFADGPLVVWLRGVDKQGSDSRTALLLYVDNTPPLIEVLSPRPEVGVHGQVRFVGKVTKRLGISSMSVQVGKSAPVPITVVPGNPFWSVDVDLNSETGSEATLFFEAIDTAGNKGSLTVKRKTDWEASLPTLVLSPAIDKGTFNSPMNLTGSLLAPDGPGGVAWTLNGGAENFEASGPSFSFPLSGVVSGRNLLSLVPVDALKRRGHPVSATFTGVLEQPQVSLESVLLPDQEVPFTPGITLAPDKKARLKVSLNLANPLKSLVWTLGNGSPVKVTPQTVKGVTTAELTLPADPPFGIVPVSVTAIDTYDQSFTSSSYLNILNFSVAQGDEGLAVVDARFGKSPILLTPETPMVGYFSSGRIRSVELVSNSKTGALPVSASFEGPLVTLKSLRDGRVEGLKLRIITEKGRLYETEFGTLFSDMAGPVIGLSAPLPGTWVGEVLKVEGQVSDAGGLAKLEWSVDNGKTWQELELPSGNSASFTRSIRLPAPDEIVNLLLRATDNAGRTGTVLTVVRRDTQGPEIDLAIPALPAGTQGTVLVTGRFQDEGAIAKAEVQLGRKPVALPTDRPFTLSLDLATYLGASIPVRATDYAGNQTEKVIQLVLQPSVSSPTPVPVASPAVEILFPTADRKGLNGPLTVMGRITGFSPVPTVSVKGESLDMPKLDLTDAGFFSFEVDASTWKDRTLVFTAANDAKQSVATNFRLPYDDAGDLPRAHFLPQPDKLILTGNVTASGWIGDNRGYVGWTTQLDNGVKTSTPPDLKKPPVGTFLVDLGVPVPGNHRLTITPVDASGKEGKPATVDFTQTVAVGAVQFSNVDFGASLEVTKNSRFQGRILSMNAWRKLEIRFADVSSPDVWTGSFQALSPVKDKENEGQWTFDTSIPTDLPYARIGVSVRGEDVLGQKIEGRTLFHRIWPKDPSAVNDVEGVVFADTRLNEATSRIEMLPGEPLSGTFRGRTLKAVTLVPPVPQLEVTFVGDKITLTALEEGLFGPFTVNAVTIDNETFSTKPFTVSADVSGPTVDWSDPSTGQWVRDSIQLAGQISDPSGVATSEVSIDSGASWTNLALQAGVFSAKFPLGSSDGLVGILIRTSDKGGHQTTAERWVTKDTSPPVITKVTPPVDFKVNGLTSIVGTAEDTSAIALIEYSEDGKVYRPADGTDVFRFNLDFASYIRIPERWYVRATDIAGNQSVTPVQFTIDQEADKPVVQIQTPANGEVVQTDFKLTGMVFDDDGVKSVSYRIDGGPWTRIDNATSFTVNEPLKLFNDNEHLIEMQAEDLYGTKGNLFSSTFRVSLSQPQALLLAPDIQKTVSGVVSLIGAGLDRNGIKEVAISLDNGLSWNRADFRKKEELLLAATTDPLAKQFQPKERQEWEWRFDTKTLKDGTYSVLIRTIDNYDVEALYTSLFNLDNTPPQVTLNTPTDGQPLLDVLKLEGRSSDNVTLQSLKAMLRLIETPDQSTAGHPTVATAVPVSVQIYDLPTTPTFSQEFPLEAMTPGWYNLRLEARDAAGNATYLARNIQIGSATSFDKIELLYPLAGETRSGLFTIAGQVTTRAKVTKALLNIDGKTKVAVDVDAKGYFQVDVYADLLDRGEHEVQASVQLTDTVTIVSEPRKIIFEPEGPYLQVVNFHNGSFVTNRPYIEGIAGWMSIQDTSGGSTIDPGHLVSAVEVSLDNGKTFTKAVGNESWKYRLESLDLPDGPLPLVFRAKFADGSTAVQRMIVYVSQTPTTVNLTKSLENSRVYGKIDLSGYTSDPTGKTKVEIALREGDKSGYGAPTFIQGLYTDSHFWGATWWEQAVGFSFSNDAVKLQAQIGQAPPSRFSGTIAGVKLIANIANIPFSYFFGPDWDWFSMSAAVGANFSLFSMSDKFLDFSGTEAKPVFLGSLLGQWEWAKVTLKNQMFFRTYSWYGEATMWFISSEIEAKAVPTFSTGLRVGIW